MILRDPAHRRTATLAGLFAGLVLMLQSPAAAVPIGAGDFGGGMVSEGFENLLPGGEVGAQPGFAGVYLPGLSGDYVFASGLVVSGPNTSVFSGDAFVHDFTSGSPPTNGWGSNGNVDGAAAVPFDEAYIGAFSGGGTTVEFTFAEPMRRFGAYVAGSGGTTITLDVYDENDVLLESVTLPAPSVAAWGTSFVGFHRPEGISRAVFSGPDFGVDRAMMETPEPPAWLLLAGLFGILRRRP